MTGKINITFTAPVLSISTPTASKFNLFEFGNLPVILKREREGKHHHTIKLMKKNIALKKKSMFSMT